MQNNGGGGKKTRLLVIHRPSTVTAVSQISCSCAVHFPSVGPMREAADGLINTVMTNPPVKDSVRRLNFVVSHKDGASKESKVTPRHVCWTSNFLCGNRYWFGICTNYRIPKLVFYLGLKILVSFVVFRGRIYIYRRGGRLSEMKMNYKVI